MTKSFFSWICILAFLLYVAFNNQPQLVAQLSTPDHVSGAGFWPTQTRYDDREYVGSSACARCHKTIFDDQQQTPMAHAATRAGSSDILEAHPDLSFASGVAHYGIRTAGKQSIYSVSNGKGQQSAELVWAFGTNRVAQSYLFKSKAGEFLEARVTYFLSLSALDFTPGRAVNSSLGLDEVMDREVGRAEVYRCFACHTTMSGINRTFDEDKLVPGIQCEACHGPGTEHLAEMKGHPVAKRAARPAMQETETTPYRILNPKRLTPQESLEFCGSCHGSYWDVSLSGSNGVANVRFEPYRLQQSKCWNKGDARLTCTACHDPHKQLETDAAAYDHVCLSCHVTKATGAKLMRAAIQDHPGAACPREVKNCTSCHMPQVYVPGMHGSFPDHRIRIAREGEAFPD